MEEQNIIPIPVPPTPADLHGIHIQIPFAAKLDRERVIVLDTESEDQNITVLGYYEMGESFIHQVFFETPVSPQLLAKTAFFQQLFLRSHYRIAIYYVGHEAALFDLDPTRCIELQPLAYAPKERYIKIQSLSKARRLPAWTRESIAEICFHNYSCLIKQIILYLGREDFARPGLKTHYLEKVNKLVA